MNNSRHRYIEVDNTKRTNFLVDVDKYEKGVKREEKPGESNGDGNILLIAGHSYSPYCSSYGMNDCRGYARSGYAEEVETRSLVKLIKSELDRLGVKSDIANALMSGDNDKMNKSFYLECASGSSLCKKYDWSKYKFALEIHFNASSNGSVKGPMLVKKSSGYSTKADRDILNAVASNTGSRALGDYIYGAHNINYFINRGVPITYLETEFYDNRSAMQVYTSKRNLIAKDIAEAIKRHYG